MMGNTAQTMELTHVGRVKRLRVPNVMSPVARVPAPRVTYRWS